MFYQFLILLLQIKKMPDGNDTILMNYLLQSYIKKDKNIINRDTSH